MEFRLQVLREKREKLNRLSIFSSTQNYIVSGSLSSHRSDEKIPGELFAHSKCFHAGGERRRRVYYTIFTMCCSFVASVG